MLRRLHKHLGLTFSLVLFVFGVISAALLLAGLLMTCLHYTGVLPLMADHPEPNNGFGPMRFLVVMVAFSAFLGTTIAAFFSRRALQPIRRVVAATHKIAEGDFSARVSIGGIHELEELSRSFNTMARELSAIETLRSDFINNFSHEFKTPIVSVRGFAKLLRDGDLTDEERREYLDIIIAESERLAELSNNVLALTTYENLKIIPDKTTFHLDEQIRRAVVLCEAKWEAKALTVNLALSELTFDGNEDLTQQIWLNLLDNAIKFTPQGGTIDITLADWNGGVAFTIADSGVGMDAQTAAHIFDKFYQGDTSHAAAGNGLGLAIVKKITELCGGNIRVESRPGDGSKFILWLPR